VLDLAVVNGAIFDGESPDLRMGTVFITNGIIVEISDRAIDPGCAVLDARGGTIVPGLIDAHFHAYATGLDGLINEARLLSYVALSAARKLRSALMRGFTTVRDVAGGDAGLAQAIDAGLLPAPMYLFTGPALSQTGGHGDHRPGDLELYACGGPHLVEVVDGVDNLRLAARDRLRKGAHAVKLFTSGGVISPTDPIRNVQYSPEEVRAVTDEANRRGSYVVAHAYSPEAIAHSVLNGVRSVEHGNLLDAPTASLMADHDVFLVPTLAAYDALDRRGPELGLAPVAHAKNREVLEAGRTAIELARAAGIPIGWGSDLMGDLEDEQLHGLRAQIEVQGPLDALRSATSVNARLLRHDDLGRVAVGMRGDLVVYPGNPLDDPSLLWDNHPGGRTVVQSGQVITG
jgi:imidazolonepropionase-like amidohydrolase